MTTADQSTKTDSSMAVAKGVKECFSLLAEHMNATHIEYTEEISILNIELSKGRWQNVRGFLRKRGNHDFIVMMSKICSLDEYPNLDWKNLLERSNNLKYCKFVIHHDYLEVVASAYFENAPLDYLEQVAHEVAHTADLLEHEITGIDVQ